MPNDTRQQCRSICAVDSGKDAIEKVIEKARERYCANRREFTIRLRRLKPRTPDFGGPQNFGSKDNFQHFCKHYICIFDLVQPTFLYYAANKRSPYKNEREGLK